MRPKKLLATAIALSLLASGSAAAARSGQSLSLAGSPALARAGAPIEDSSELRRRGILGWILGLAAIGIVIFVVTELSKNNDLPASA